LFLQLLSLPRFLYIAYIIMNAHVVLMKNAKIIKYIVLGLEYNFPSLISGKLGFLESIVKFIGQGTRVLGVRYQTWSKSYQTLPKASK
jgi:hypothetical protein